MESKYNSLIPNFKQSQPTNEFTLTKYYIISKTYEIFDIYLPHPQTIIDKINNNNHIDLITIDISTFISFYNLQTKTINLSEIDLTLRKSGDLIGEMQSGENKYVELMLQHQPLFKHISEELIPTLLDEGTIDDFIEYRYNKENNIE